VKVTGLSTRSNTTHRDAALQTESYNTKFGQKPLPFFTALEISLRQQQVLFDHQTVII
jgi:hypothetical protein